MDSQPLGRHAAGGDRPRRRGRCRRRGGRRAGGAGRRLGRTDRHRARPPADEDERAGAGTGRRTGAAGGAGRGQAAQAGPRRRGGAGALPGVLRRRGRQGDGRDDSLRQRLHRAHAARAARRHGPHRALELPDADHRPQRRRGAGDGQRLRAQAGRRSLPDGAGLCAHRRTRPAAGRCAERGAGPGRRGRCGAVGPPRRAPHLVHRLGGGGRADPGRGGAQRRAGDAGTGWQEPAAGVCRRRPGRRAALPGQRRHPERGPDLLGGVAHPGAAAGVRRGGARMAERYRALRVGPALDDPDVGPGDQRAPAGDRARATWPGAGQRPAHRRPGPAAGLAARSVAATCRPRWWPT
jgi:hypothetical protein